MKVSFKKSLVFLLFFSAHTGAQASVVCSTLWVNGYPERGRTDSTDGCEQYFPESTSLGTGQQIYFQNRTIENPNVKQHLEWTAEAFSYSANKYSAFASVPKIRFVYSERPFGSDTSDASTFAFSYVEFFQLGAEFCPIVIYPTSLSLSKDHFYQLIAHEIYHCVQKVNFPAQTSAAVQHTSDGAFWYESIAQFMSNDVYPAANFEYHPMFGVFDPHLPFFEQSSPYLAEGFFQGLFWYQGSSTSNVHRIQSGFGSSGATAVQDVLRIPDISQAFHKTARDMSFNELRDSSGAMAPWRAEKQLIQVPIQRSSSITISFMDFAIEPFEILFPKKGRYRLSINRMDGAKLSVRKAGTTLWQDQFDTVFMTDCDQDRKLEGIYTRASADLSLNAIRIDIERLDNETCPCELETPPNDTCLFGTWQVDLQSVKSFMQQLVGPAFQINSASGGVKLIFTPGGEHSWDYQNLVLDGIMRTRRETQVKWRWNGVTQLAYTNQATEVATQVCTKVLRSSVKGEATMTARGRTVNLPGGAPGFGGEGLVNYSCNASTFTYQMMAGPIPFDWVFHRVP